jgi:hypothetical protein
MKWYCEAFRSAFEERHDRGIFVFCEPTTPLVGGPPTYWIGMRSVRFADRERFAEQCAQHSDKPPVPITLATWRRIKWCPWCGRGTERFYAKTYGDLADGILTEEHGWKAEQAVPPDAPERRRARER